MTATTPPTIKAASQRSSPGFGQAVDQGVEQHDQRRERQQAADHQLHRSGDGLLQLVLCFGPRQRQLLTDQGG